MLVPKETILLSKEQLGEKAIEEIVDYFKLENWDEKNLKGSCPFGHVDDTPSFIWNQKNNSFHCFSCNRNFDVLDLYMLQGNTYLGALEKLFRYTKTDFKFSEKGTKTTRAYRYPHHEQSDNRNAVEKYWSLRKISKETLDYADVQQDEHGNTVFHYYDTNDVLTNVKYRTSSKDKRFWSQPDKDTTPILYGMNQIDTTKDLLIVEGESDRLSCIESGFYNVVSVPFGAGNETWIETNWDFLEQFDKIIVWSDNDKPGLEMRKNVCARLGSWRTLFVDLPEKIDDKSVKDANTVLFYFGKQKVLDLIANAQEVPVQNIVNLADVADFDIEAATGLFSSIKAIGKIIYKYVFGSVVLLTGAKGSGKSALLNQEFVCGSLQQGQDIFLFSGELGNDVLKSWIELTMAGREHIKMKDEFVHIIDKESRLSMQKWYSGRILCYDNNTNDADEILDRAVTVTRRYGVKVWILDNLMTMDIGATGNDIYEKQKQFIVKLVALAKTYHVLIVLVAHPRKTTELRRLVADDVAGSNDLGNLAQYIMGIHRYSKSEKEGEKNDQNGRYKKGKEPIDFDADIDIFKNRYTGKVGDCPVYFDYASYRFYQTPQELFFRYGWNKDESPLPTRDPNKHQDMPEAMSE